MSIRAFVDRHYRHFNAKQLRRAAIAYEQALADGAPMMITLAGAMSTAELGRSLAEMIRRDKVHAICCTGANLEEDIFNLVAHSHYRELDDWRTITTAQERELLGAGYNRVTDTCIPEEEAIRRVERRLIERWKQAQCDGARHFPHEFLYAMLLDGELESMYEIDPRDSWLLAAAQRDLPMFVPGWEDSTLGNVFAARIIDGTLDSPQIVRSGIESMISLCQWYKDQSAGTRAPGFFQIGGGIAGDFPICVVPMIRQDLHEDVPLWSYFCQISDSTTSYGSYSGAVPNEKITWEKIDADTPRFVIESDATIVAPIIFEYLLEG